MEHKRNQAILPPVLLPRKWEVIIVAFGAISNFLPRKILRERTSDPQAPITLKILTPLNCVGSGQIEGRMMRW